MLLAIDVGNSQTVIGLFGGDEVRGHWRAATRAEETADEKAAHLASLLALEGFSLDDISDAVLASVVPACTTSIMAMARRHLRLEPLVVGPDTDSGLIIKYKRPEEVGADRIANAVAGHQRFGACLIVDFGTATTFDVVTAKAEYVGGVIAPGVETSAEALFRAAARLSRVELAPPPKVVGKDTVASLQSGIIFGAAALTDGLVRSIRKETGAKSTVVATGGLADLVAPHCAAIERVEPLLTIEGLRIIFTRQ